MFGGQFTKHFIPITPAGCLGWLQSQIMCLKIDGMNLDLGKWENDLCFTEYGVLFIVILCIENTYIHQYLECCL